MNKEKKRVTVLTLLDHSAAFDTIDHDALIKKYLLWFVIYGIALSWSHLADRGQNVKIGERVSDNYTIKFGVPHGSVLGPIFLRLYTTSLSSIIQKNSLVTVSHQLYADDTHLFGHFKARCFN